MLLRSLFLIKELADTLRSSLGSIPSHHTFPQMSLDYSVLPFSLAFSPSSPSSAHLFTTAVPGKWSKTLNNVTQTGFQILRTQNTGQYPNTAGPNQPCLLFSNPTPIKFLISQATPGTASRSQVPSPLTWIPSFSQFPVQVPPLPGGLPCSCDRDQRAEGTYKYCYLLQIEWLASVLFDLQSWRAWHVKISEFVATLKSQISHKSSAFAACLEWPVIWKHWA